MDLIISYLEAICEIVFLTLTTTDWVPFTKLLFYVVLVDQVKNIIS